MLEKNKQLACAILLLLSASVLAPTKSWAKNPPIQQSTRPGMNAAGEVINSSLIEPGFGQKFKGGGIDGEIIGKPSARSKFNQILIGMSIERVMRTIGAPDNYGDYKAKGNLKSSPIYMSCFKREVINTTSTVYGARVAPCQIKKRGALVEMVYKGQGRLVFQGGDSILRTKAPRANYLILMIHNPNESGEL